MHFLVETVTKKKQKSKSNIEVLAGYTTNHKNYATKSLEEFGND